MLTKTQGIVFHAFKYGESSLITEVYTRDYGLRRYIASGVRSKKPRFSAALFQVMTPLELVVYHREDKDLNRMKEARAAEVLESIPFDIRRGAIALFLAEVSRRAIREAGPNEELYQFLARSVYHLDRSAGLPRMLPVFFLARLTSFIGFEPSGDFSTQSPYFHLEEGAFRPDPPVGRAGLAEPESRMLYELLCADWESFQTLEPPPEEVRRLLQRLLDYYRLHLPNFPELRSPGILRQVFTSK